MTLLHTMDTDTKILTPTIRTTLLGAETKMTITDSDSVHIWLMEDVTINGIIHQSTTATMTRREDGSWYGNPRLYRYGAVLQRATDSASSKFYRACVELAEGIPEEALHEGARVKMLHDYQSLLRDQANIAAEMRSTRAYFVDAFDEGNINDHCPTCTCNWADAAAMDGYSDMHCPSCTCHIQSSFVTEAPTRAILVVDDGVVDGLFSAGNAPVLPLEIVQVNTGDISAMDEDDTAVVGDEIVIVRGVHVGRVFHHDITEAFEASDRIGGLA